MKRSKSLSQLDGEEHQEALRKLYEYMNSSDAYGKTGTGSDAAHCRVYSHTTPVVLAHCIFICVFAHS